MGPVNSRIITDGFTHSYYKNKYILIVSDNNLQNGRKQLRYYDYNVKVANNYLASRLNSNFLK